MDLAIYSKCIPKGFAAAVDWVAADPNNPIMTTMIETDKNKVRLGGLIKNS